MLKTLNVSLQSKKYGPSINKIVEKWKEDGLNISPEVCKAILMKDKIESNATLLQVLSAYDLVEKILKMKGISDESMLESIFSEMIKIDMNKLSTLFTEEVSKEKPMNHTKEEKIEEKSEKKEEKELKVENSIEIPTDFLMND